MNPGRELDALVAEKVMGWRLGEHLGMKRNVWKLPEGQKLNGLDWCNEPPLYSTNIAAAWEVIEKLNICIEVLRVKEAQTGSWQYVASTVSGRTIADAAPHAICLAALKAVDG